MIARDFLYGVRLAVNDDGDSNYTGSITGNLLGVMHGVDAIPKRWLDSLELREVIAELAEDLYECCEWQIGEGRGQDPFSARILEKYPGI